MTFLKICLGPYFKYRTFQDSYQTGYEKYAECSRAMLMRVRPVPFYVVFFLLSSYIWPLEVKFNFIYVMFSWIKANN